MIPTDFKERTQFLGAPANWDESQCGECMPLPVLAEPDGLTSLWMPDSDELKILNEGGAVAIKVGTHPVMLVGAAHVQRRD